MRTDLENLLVAMVIDGWANEYRESEFHMMGEWVALVVIRPDQLVEIEAEFSDENGVPVGNFVVSCNSDGVVNVQNFPTPAEATTKYEELQP